MYKPTSSKQFRSAPNPQMAMLFLLAVSGCSLSATPESPVEIIRDENYKVTVKSDGQEQKNFNQERVHRVAVPRKEINDATQNSNAGVKLPVTVQIERDLRGTASGLKITAVTSKRSTLGLLRGDVVTSVGTTLTRSERDLGRVYQELKQNQQTSLTLLRGGEYHKFLYFVDPNS